MAYDKKAFQRDVDVSRETLDKLEQYHALLVKYQKAVNLVGPSTLPEAWKRHFLDSAQLLDHLDDMPKSWIDFGSGAGFPGMVLAIMGVENMTMVESDQRKSLFIKNVSRETKTPVTVLTQRIEKVDAQPVDVISARALASLGKLLDFAEPFLKPDTICLFPKGQDVDIELDEASKSWHFDVYKQPSKVADNSWIVRLQNVCRRN